MCAKTFWLGYLNAKTGVYQHLQLSFERLSQVVLPKNLKTGVYQHLQVICALTRLQTQVGTPLSGIY